MQILIFGATGPCGILLIRKSIQIYPEASIILYARSPQKIPEDLTSHASVSTITGSLDELSKVEDILQSDEGIDLIFSALGPTGPFHTSGHPIANFYGHLIDLIVKHNVVSGTKKPRLIVLGTAAYSDPNDRFSSIMFPIINFVRTFAPYAFAEFREVGKVLKAKGEETGVEWTLVRVPVLSAPQQVVDQENELVVAGYVGDGKTGPVLARKGFAAFCVSDVEKREWVNKAPFISQG